MSSVGRTNMGIGGMPRLNVPVHAEVAQGIKAYALTQDISVCTLVRELLYDFARNELDIAVEDLPPTKMSKK
ncbi:hypothetical protein [Streptomyces neyagawaensis]|uniref:hypothetical protein n=1 Tax=Streptomyces neyagawaensis TaxID=42238 RepID=UPI0012FF424C|nr:hypothetical protein [Streptomyces neyagawaensis]MCL6738017.1 hypothetical protein [Streptomyces neyagawaensis]MDE1688322.1 hypothetical protein [Streptomyces neyagawaensis]